MPKSKPFFWHHNWQRDTVYIIILYAGELDVAFPKNVEIVEMSKINLHKLKGGVIKKYKDLKAILKEHNIEILFNYLTKPNFIGCNVIICNAVTIGKGAIVGAGSIVTKDIPANVIAAGSPAKVVKTINEQIIRLWYLTLLIFG